MLRVELSPSATRFGGQKVLGLIIERTQGPKQKRLSRNKFINAKQSKRSTKVPPLDRRTGRLKKELCIGGHKTSSFYWGMWTQGG
jgi:hypothetical protein